MSSETSVYSNPAVEAFVASIGEGKAWAEVWIEWNGGGFLLRHVADRSVKREELRRVAVAEARKIGMFTGAGVFRPLRSAPDLSRGWLIECNGVGELWRVLQEIYPGSVADWYAVRAERANGMGGVAVTNYREFTGRQTGMYRITQLLTDEQAGMVTRAACHAQFCLKRRLWTVAGLEVDGRGVTDVAGRRAVGGKSEIPCLEPCAILLELARKAMRIEQEEKVEARLSRSEVESMLAAAEAALGRRGGEGEVEGGGVDRVGNVGAAGNGRRLQLLIEKFKKFGAAERGK